MFTGRENVDIPNAVKYPVRVAIPRDILRHALNDRYFFTGHFQTPKLQQNIYCCPYGEL